MARIVARPFWIYIAAALFVVGTMSVQLADMSLFGPPQLLAAVTRQEEPLTTAEPPEWTFSVYDFRDPYKGPIQQPALPGTRVVGAEVEIVNNSDKSLTVYLNNMRLHTDIDRTYPSGLVIGVPDNGEELVPNLAEGTVEPEQRIRGWVWWRVPEGEALVEIVFFPSPPPPSTIPLPIGNAPTDG